MPYSTISRAGSAAGGGKPTGYDPAYGGIPNLPDYTTDYTKSTTVGPDVQAELIKNLPGYQSMLGQDVANIGSNLAGRVAPDVISLLQQQAAERGVATGTVGAPNTDAAYLRALGLTSLQLQQLGNTQLTAAMARTPVQQIQTTTGQVQRSLAAEKAIYQAAPVPRAAAQQAIQDAQMGMSRGGGLGYGGGGGVTISPATPRPPVTATPSPDWGMPKTYGASGAPAVYPGYTWDPATGTYVKTQKPYTSYDQFAFGGGGFYGAGTPEQVSAAREDQDVIDYYGELGYDQYGNPPEFTQAEIEASIFGEY